MNKKRRLLLLKGLVWLFGLAPLVWLIWRGLTDRLGPNPIEEFLHHLGDTALIYLLITLSITPVRRLTGWNILAPLRRPIGLFAFFYLTMHFLWYAVLDQTLDFEFIIEDVVERPYILAGFTAWLLLIPLAITSTRGWIREAQEELAEAPSIGLRGDQPGRAAFLLAGEGGYLLAARGRDRAGRLIPPSYSLAEERGAVHHRSP